MISWQLLLSTLIAISFAGICVWRFEITIAVFIALLPTYLLRFSIPLPGLTLPTTLLEILFLLLFVSWIFYKKDLQQLRSVFSSWMLPLTLLLTVSAISVAIAPDLRAALGQWRAYIIEPIIFFVIFVSTIITDKDRRRIFFALGLLAIVVGITAVVQKLTGFGIPNPWQEELVRRTTSFFGFPNAVGLLMAPIAVMMTGWGIKLFQEKRWEEVLFAALAAIAALAACFLAISEGALFGIAAGIGILALLTPALRKLAIGAGVIGLIVIFSVPFLRQYAVTALTFNDDGGSVRRIIWNETAQMLKERPVFGGGLGGYPGTIADFHDAKHIEIFQYPHTIVLNIWSELGILGLIVFIWLIAHFFYRAAQLTQDKHNNWLANALIAAMVAVLVHGLVDVPYFKNDLSFLWWMMFGLLASMMAECMPKGIIEKKHQIAELPSLPRR